MKASLWVAATIAVTMLLGAPASAQTSSIPTSSTQTAATYPNKPVRIIVPFAPGGASDILARSIGQKFTEKLGQPVIVENKPGADGMIGADLTAKAAPDGHTLLLLDISTITMAKALYAKPPFDPAKEFAGVSMLVFSPHALVVHPSVPANNLKELQAWAKENPGKLNFGSSSGATYLAELQLQAESGIQLLHVPYKGGAAALTALTGGEINIVLNSMLATLSHIRGGKIKGLAVAGEKRLAAAPEIPTIIESGLPGFVTGSWQGLLAPAGTPKDIVAKIQATVHEIMMEAELNKRLTGMGADVIAGKPEAFDAFLASEQTRWTKIAADAGVKPE
jgi:tripartite-type tricarboxylate transporter receptor subunit TctC